MIPVASGTKTIKEHHKGIANTLALALIPLSGFATDVYLPSMPSMARSLHISDLQIQLTLTVFLISYGLSQLFVGSFLDSFGRYKISLAGLLIFAMASLTIAFSTNIYVILLMRAIHGITVGAVVVAKRAYFIDLYKDARLKHYLSIFSIIWSTGPIIAPFIGGYLEHGFGWQSNFFFLAIFAFAFAILEIIFSGETLKEATVFKLKKIAMVYLEMFSTTSFILGIMMLGFAYCMVMIYNMTGPFIIEHTMGLSPVVAGYSSLILGTAWMTGGFLGKATIRIPLIKKSVTDLIVQLAFVIVMLWSVQFVSNLYALIFFAFMIHVAAGYTFNNFFTFCLGRFPQNGGTASGLTGGVTYVIVSIFSSGIVSAFPAKDASNLGFSYLILILASVLVMFILARNKDIKTS